MTIRWIGVDLNTTGHAVVAADPVTGTVVKLGKKLQYARSSSTKNCTKLYREQKLWKLKRNKSREKKEFRAAVHQIARRIVAFAESACAGIRFEKLFQGREFFCPVPRNCTEFSFDNGSFLMLLGFVEKRALNRGIPVQYVNPLNTSRKCSRCGGFGVRMRKRFVCPQCGRVIHADVNAALNIASASVLSPPAAPGKRAVRKEVRKLARSGRMRICGNPGEVFPVASVLSGSVFFWKDLPAMQDELA